MKIDRRFRQTAAIQMLMKVLKEQMGSKLDREGLAAAAKKISKIPEIPITLCLTLVEILIQQEGRFLF